MAAATSALKFEAGNSGSAHVKPDVVWQGNRRVLRLELHQLVPPGIVGFMNRAIPDREAYFSGLYPIPFPAVFDCVAKKYKLLDEKGKTFISRVPGKFGGHKRLKIYGRLDCPSALRFIAMGKYVKSRVFFLDEKTARAAGYRPCARCMPEAYRAWKKKQ